MSAASSEDQHGGEALQAAQYAKRDQAAQREGPASGSAQIASVVLRPVCGWLGRLWFGPEPSMLL